MPITATVFGQTVFGNKRVAFGVLTGLSATWPAGGDPVTVAEMSGGRMASEDIMIPVMAGGYVFEYSEDGKLRAYQQSAATGALTEATGEDLSAVDVPYLLIGI